MIKARINGLIEKHNYIIKRISLWKDYLKRIPLGKSIKHNKKVKILGDYGNYVLIKRYFIKGFINKKYLRFI